MPLKRVAADADINEMLYGPGRHEKCEEGGIRKIPLHIIFPLAEALIVRQLVVERCEISRASARWNLEPREAIASQRRLETGCIEALVY